MRTPATSSFNTDRVRITDVSPRDGLQNEPGQIATQRKADLVRALAQTGVDEIELTSFVSPKWIPQLGDAAELCALLAADRLPLPLEEGRGEGDRLPLPSGGGWGEGAGIATGANVTSPVFSALVPNDKGMERLIACNEQATKTLGRDLITKVSLFAAASETFSQKNTNASIAEVMSRFIPVIDMAKEHGLFTRGYVSCVIACPYEGAIEPQAVAAACAQLIELGIDEIDLGDTIGSGTPETVSQMLEAVFAVVQPAWGTLANTSDTGNNPRLTLHLHDTFGNAAHCVRTSLDMGIRSFDSAAGGLGGCPYAGTKEKPAPGNIDTALLVQTCKDAGCEVSVKDEELAVAGQLARELKGSGGAHG